MQDILIEPHNLGLNSFLSEVLKPLNWPFERNFRVVTANNDRDW